MITNLNSKKRIDFVTINKNSLQLLLLRNETFNIIAKEDNHIGKVKLNTNSDFINKDLLDQYSCIILLIINV